jgi:hypothetical protein
MSLASRSRFKGIASYRNSLLAWICLLCLPLAAAAQPAVDPLVDPLAHPAAVQLRPLLEELLGEDTDAPPRPAEVAVRLLQTPSDAVIAAERDLQHLIAQYRQRGLELDTSVYRYIWIPDGNPEDRALVSFVLNSVVSRSDINYVPGRAGSPIQYVDGGRLVRVDLLLLCPLNKGKDFEQVAAVWDQLSNPYFLLQKNEIKTIKQLKQKVVEQAPAPAAQPAQPAKRMLRVKGDRLIELLNGKEVVATLKKGDQAEILKTTFYSGQEWAQISVNGKPGFVQLSDNVEIIEPAEQPQEQPARAPRLEVVEEIVEEEVNFKSNAFGPHVDVEAASSLQGLTSVDPDKLTVNPIVWCYSLYKGALTQADGGQYYDFMGIRKANARPVFEPDRVQGRWQGADLRAEQRAPGLHPLRRQRRAGRRGPAQPGH